LDCAFRVRGEGWAGHEVVTKTLELNRLGFRNLTG
jgi:hypothetical protein